MAITSTVSVNSSRERSRATCTMIHGTTLAPPPQMMATSAASFSSASGSATPQVAGAGLGRRSGAIAQRRNQHQHDDREDVLDDQPAHRDVAVDGVEHAVVRQHAHQHDGAGHRHGHAQHQPGFAAASRTPRPPPRASSVATRLCPIAPGIATLRTASRSSR